ncbi:MAG: YceD family protein [Candidatus Marithrix sp.]
MLETLPEWIHSQHLAAKRHNLIGQIAVSKLSQRLCDNLYSKDGYVQINWQFILDNKKRPTISGQIQAQLQMLCQRCLTPVTTTVNAKIALVIFTEEPSKYEKIPPNYESIILPNKPILLFTLIENELILALPIVARHEICPTNEFQLEDEQANDIIVEQDNNPFNMLAKLK